MTTSRPNSCLFCKTASLRTQACSNDNLSAGFVSPLQNRVPADESLFKRHISARNIVASAKPRPCGREFAQMHLPAAFPCLLCKFLGAGTRACSNDNLSARFVSPLQDRVPADEGLLKCTSRQLFLVSSANSWAQGRELAHMTAPSLSSSSRPRRRRAASAAPEITATAAPAGRNGSVPVPPVLGIFASLTTTT